MNELFNATMEKLYLVRIYGTQGEPGGLQFIESQSIDSIPGNGNLEIRLIGRHPFITDLGRTQKRRTSKQ
jgi:hypothetical protein